MHFTSKLSNSLVLCIWNFDPSPEKDISHDARALRKFRNRSPIHPWSSSGQVCSFVSFLTKFSSKVLYFLPTFLIPGPMLKSITFDMIQKTKNSTFLQNLHIYSGSDNTLETVMIALNVYNHIRPYFGSALIFELRKRNNDSLVSVNIILCILTWENQTLNAYFFIPITIIALFADIIQKYNWQSTLLIDHTRMRALMYSWKILTSYETRYTRRLEWRMQNTFQLFSYSNSK